MGRKDKLRREQARRKLENTTSVPAAAATTVTKLVKSPPAPTSNGHEFPKSDLYIRTLQEIEERNNCVSDEIFDKLIHCIIAYKCVHSMAMAGQLYLEIPISHGNRIQSAQPLLFEGAIRGSAQCASGLVSGVYMKAAPRKPEALILYWSSMLDKYNKMDGGSRITSKEYYKGLTDYITRKCAICNKKDTDTLTLRQCIGCSKYCYCSKACQTIHGQDSHRNECKQLQILEQYHKPFAVEIRDALIRGEIEVPALEKLRQKLGLTRPIEEYKELLVVKTPDGKVIDGHTPDGKTIDPYRCLVARDDGTVWIGSIPDLNESPSFDTATATTNFDCLVAPSRIASASVASYFNSRGNTISFSSFVWDELTSEEKSTAAKIGCTTEKSWRKMILENQR